MTLRVYETATGTPVPFSIDALFTNPLIVSFDGRTGGTLEKLLYVRNHSALYEYEDITLTLEQSGGSTDLIGGTNGFYYKLKVGDTQPTTEEWESITAANTITLSDITDIITYLPFWIYIEVPRGVNTQTIGNVSFKIAATKVLA